MSVNKLLIISSKCGRCVMSYSFHYVPNKYQTGSVATLGLAEKLYVCVSVFVCVCVCVCLGPSEKE